ncbi:tubulin-tyrosine ligase [Chloropicon primus]|uniref:Tubulin-tyrosine ligase n=1 Tax=Chloropicon primus TaxID=1764295 RepID=A0A5B8MRY0_9CHLO|nr:tubulin-tyrosine ligase [Chloropicon primus]UPR02384.1 tubulin-tyrosine ligase [Chloropicon primus]|eukprot:QDZ23171.1 tubulin-tyrosine ligase [Chloropicon primus]
MKGEIGAQNRYLVLPGNEPSLVLEALGKRGWWKEAADDTNYDFWWGGNGQRFPFDSLKQGKRREGPSSTPVFNKIDNHREICTKTGLARTISECCTSQKKTCLEWAPETYTFSRYGSLSEELSKLKRAYRRYVKRASESAQKSSGGCWILKPAAMNRGRGIRIFDNIKDIETFLRSRVSSEAYIAQKYIENPLLIENRKFDIRSFVLVTSDPSRVYLHSEGYIRTCSVEYKHDDVGDGSLASHLTNDAVQKTSSEYGSFEDCNKMSFDGFENAMRASGRSDFDFRKDIYSQIKRCTEELFRVAMKKMKPHKIRGSFELFGLDFMCDEALQVFLVEVNTSPALFRRGEHLKKILPLVMEEVLQKAVDPYFPPTRGEQWPKRLNHFEELAID